MPGVIGHPVKFRGKAIIAKKKNGASSSPPTVSAGKVKKILKVGQPKPVVDKTAALLARIGEEIEAGNFDASIGFDEKVTLYVVALDGHHHLAVTTDDVVTASVGDTYPGGDAGYVKAVHGAADWVANH